MISFMANVNPLLQCQSGSTLWSLHIRLSLETSAVCRLHVFLVVLKVCVVSHAQLSEYDLHSEHSLLLHSHKTPQPYRLHVAP